MMTTGWLTCCPASESRPRHTNYVWPAPPARFLFSAPAGGRRCDLCLRLEADGRIFTPAAELRKYTCRGAGGSGQTWISWEGNAKKNPFRFAEYQEKFCTKAMVINDDQGMMFEETDFVQHMMTRTIGAPL